MASFCFYSSQLLLKGIWRPSCNNRPRAFLRSLSFPLQSSPSLIVTVQQTNHNSKAIRSPKLIQTLVKIEQPGRIEETKWKGQVLLFGCQTQKSNTNKISFPASPTRNLPSRGWQNRHPRRTTTSKMIHNTILTVTPPNPHCVNRRPTWGPALMDFDEKKNHLPSLCILNFNVQRFSYAVASCRPLKFICYHPILLGHQAKAFWIFWTHSK